jgi:phage FluMu protein Com
MAFLKFAWHVSEHRPHGPVFRGRDTRREIKVECLRCRHVGQIMDVELSLRGIKRDALIVSFIKRLRCRKCGSRTVRATRAADRKAS